VLAAVMADVVAPLALFPEWLTPTHILENYGFWAIIAIIFAETGLLIGFFLPGDTLLFSAGILTELGTIEEPLWLLMIAVPLAAIAGNLVGYEIGRRAGPALFSRPDSRFFRQDHLTRSHRFFVRYGPLTIFLARFVPIVRTFAAVVAGAVAMDRRVFLIWSIIGAVAWCSGLIGLGYVIAASVPESTREWILDHIDMLIVGVVALTVVAVVVETRFGHLLHGKKDKGGDASDAAKDDDAASSVPADDA